MPTFVYLLPVVLFFGIGASAPWSCTLDLRAAAASSGSRASASARSPRPRSRRPTRPARRAWQRLTKVQLPMARKTIIVGLNQTIMAALSMATIAAFVDGPGLGQPVLDGAESARRRRRVRARHADRGDGDHARPHHDRGQRGVREGGPRWQVNLRRRRIVLAVTGARRAGRGLPVAPASSGCAEFPETTWGPTRRRASTVFTDWFTDTFRRRRPSLVKDVITESLLNPLQELLAESPWWLVGAGDRSPSRSSSAASRARPADA